MPARPGRFGGGAQRAPDDAPVLEPAFADPSAAPAPALPDPSYTDPTLTDPSLAPPATADQGFNETPMP